MADSPFLPAQGGGEREHLGFVRAAAQAGTLGVLVVPSSEPLDLASYDEVTGGAPVVVTQRRENKLLLAAPSTPYVVSSRPVRPELVDDVRRAAPDATGVVVFSYKSWRIGEAIATGLGLPAVLRQHNLEGPYHHSLAAGTPGPKGVALELEARRIDRDERRLERAPWLSAIADISATDAAVRRARGAAALHVPPFAHDPELLALPRTPSPEPRVLFLGALDVATNTAALGWVLDHVWPHVVQSLPAARLVVVGRRPSSDLATRLERADGVELHADVPDLTDYLARATLAINPAVSGSGVNIKLVDYLQAGVPVVSTTIGSQGLGLVDDSALLVRDEPGPFADAVVELLRDPEHAERLGAVGRGRIRELLDPAVNVARVDAALAAPRPLAPADPDATPGSGALQVQVARLEWLSTVGRGEWDALFDDQVTSGERLANPFCAPEWIEAWYRHFTAPEDRLLLLVRRGAQLVGVAPFFEARSTLGGVRASARLRLVGAGQGGSLLELPQVLVDHRHARAVLREVVAATRTARPAGRPVDWTELSVPTSQGWFEPEWSYSSGEKVAFFRAQMARACVVLELAPTWDAVRSGLRRNLKESLRRSRNRLSKDGREWEVVTLSDDLDARAVDRLLDLHRRRSEHLTTVRHGDAFAAAGTRAFLHDLLPALGRAGRAELAQLRLGGDVVAVQLALRAPGVTYFHSSGLDPRTWELGPVTFLQEHLVRRAVERGDRWVNFSPGPNVSKLRWSSRIDVHQDFAYGSGSPSLRWKYAAFAARQVRAEVDHAVAMSQMHQAPARALPPGGGVPRG